MSIIQRQIKHLLRDDSSDPYFEVTNIDTGKVTKFDEGSLYIMLGVNIGACDELNRLAKTGQVSNDGKFKVKKIHPQKS